MRVPGLVSTIIPVFNRPRLLREAVESVLEQDHRPIEILIVDDGSSDDTPTVTRQLADASPDAIRVFRQANAGPGAARERGRREARGEFLQYLDSDDILLPGKFSRQVTALRSRPDADVAYGWTRYRLADGSVHPSPWKGSGERREKLYPSILVERWWSTPNPLYRAAICDRAGPWLPLSNEEDWEYDVRIGVLGATLVHVGDYLCEWRDHHDERLCRTGLETRGLRDRARAHEAMFRSAVSSALPRESPEFASFARRLFLLSRQCGAAGLADESKTLFELARGASTPARKKGLDFLLYGVGARLLGWALAGRIACWSDRLRPYAGRA